MTSTIHRDLTIFQRVKLARLESEYAEYFYEVFEETPQIPTIRYKGEDLVLRAIELDFADLKKVVLGQKEPFDYKWRIDVLVDLVIKELIKSTENNKRKKFNVKVKDMCVKC